MITEGIFYYKIITKTPEIIRHNRMKMFGRPEKAHEV